MKYNRLFLVSFLAAASSWLLPCTADAGSPANRLKVDTRSLTQYVDPLIGTAHCRWFHLLPVPDRLEWPNRHLPPMVTLVISGDGRQRVTITGISPSKVFPVYMNSRWAELF